MSATNMPGEGSDAVPVGMVPLQAANDESRDSAGPMPLLPPSPRGPKNSRSQVFASKIPVSANIDSFPLPGMVYITINSAQLSSSKPRNMMVVTEQNGKSIHKTRVEKDATRAEWNDKDRLPVLTGSAPVLTLAVKDHSSFRGDKTLFDFIVKPFDLLKDDLVKSNGTAAGPRDVNLTSEGGSLSLNIEFSGGETSALSDAFDTQSITGSARKMRHGRHSSVFSRKSIK
ncbi:hypothetical protein EC988_008033 [Linderina pennispora]|nr:hypothetical protein EC988_008033 [Linderina pennispora]